LTEGYFERGVQGVTSHKALARHHGFEGQQSGASPASRRREAKHLIAATDLDIRSRTKKQTQC
jgi:hypothetical protein